MKKGNIYEGIVKKVEFPNKAYVEVIEKDENGNEQKTLTIVKGALPGQKIKFRAKKVRKDKSQGILLEVTENRRLRQQNQCAAGLENAVDAVIRHYHMKNSLNLREIRCLR